ncbi:MAG: hypothetical protein D6722_25635 [Bacteroidetes bacterium]|nr:MAG: hypothetical protein D6722_25635 [Bacteroidota bacterium]
MAAAGCGDPGSDLAREYAAGHYAAAAGGGAAEADSLLRLSLAYLTALLGAGHEETQATRHLLGASAP